MRISDWSSDVCSSDLQRVGIGPDRAARQRDMFAAFNRVAIDVYGEIVAIMADKRTRCDAFDQHLGFAPKGDQVGDCADLPVMLGGERDEEIGRAWCGGRGRQYE